MTDTRMVRLEQIAVNFEPNKMFVDSINWHIEAGLAALLFPMKCEQIADPTGGDVFKPVNGIEAALAEALRRAKWPHLVQVEVVNG